MGGEERWTLEITYTTIPPNLYFQFLFQKRRLAPELKHQIEMRDTTEDKMIYSEPYFMCISSENTY